MFWKLSIKLPTAFIAFPALDFIARFLQDFGIKAAVVAAPTTRPAAIPFTKLFIIKPLFKICLLIVKYSISRVAAVIAR